MKNLVTYITEGLKSEYQQWFKKVYKTQQSLIKDNIDIKKSLEDNIKNEEGAIETYEELVKMTEDVDPTSNSKLKEILADEQEHLQELKDFLNDIK